MERVCVDCEANIDAHPGAGRPRIRCQSCATKKNKADSIRYSASDSARAKRAAYRQQFVCKRCGAQFLAQSYRAHCSPECNAAYIESLKRKDTCQHCGVEFRAKSPRYRKYCSRECAFADNASSKHRKVKLNLSSEHNSNKVYFVECQYCGKTFTARNKASRLCSDECRGADASKKSFEKSMSKHVAKSVTCPECGGQFSTEYGKKKRKFCSTECGKKHNARIAKMTRKARTRGAESEKIDPFIVFGIYGWECFSCKTPTPKHLRGTCDDAAPELDHIIPLSKGGAHTYSNVQLLCRKCNGIKSDSV